jgi:hypothetical protein
MPRARIARQKCFFDMDALVDALERDPEKHAAGLDAGWRPVFLPTNAEHVCAEIMLKE